MGSWIAAALRQSWRSLPPPFDLPPEALAAVAPRLVSTGAGGLGWWRVRGSPLAATPAAHDLQQAFRLHAVRAMVHEREIGRALSCLEAVGIEPILGKGWAIARSYPDPALRPYGDLDLYVRPALYERARAALADIDAPVDLHRGFAQTGRTADEVHRHSEQADLDGHRVRVFGAEDHLRLLTSHLLGHGAWRPLWLCDIGLAVESRPTVFDWDYALAGGGGQPNWLATAVHLAHRLLGARIDDAERVLPHRAGDWLAAAVLRQWEQLDFEPHGRRTPLRSLWPAPADLIAGLRSRWPNPIEATVGTGRRFSDAPGRGVQVAECLRRGWLFARGRST